jgi:hypothetical protein
MPLSRRHPTGGFTEAHLNIRYRGALFFAHRSTIFCSSARPSVSAAGPSRKISDDLISYTS